MRRRSEQIGTDGAHGSATASVGPLIACGEAAELLDVSTIALCAWSRMLEFPRDVGGAASPQFRRDDVEALQATLPGAHSVAGAICAARRRVA